MNGKQMGLRLLAAMILVGLLVGCSSPTATVAPTTAPTTAPTVAPTAVATIDLQPTFNGIKTQSAATVIANLTQNAPSASPVAPATATKPPLATSTTAASSTPAPSATATKVAILTPWTLVPTKAAYNCSIVDFSPKKTTTVSPSSNFDVHWVVRNTGTLRWLPTETILRYVDGEKMQKKANFLMLGADVAPNDTYDLGIDMVAPVNTGTYNITWRLTYGNVSICTLGLSVVVK